MREIALIEIHAQRPVLGIDLRRRIRQKIVMLAERAGIDDEIAKPAGVGIDDDAAKASELLAFAAANVNPMPGSERSLDLVSAEVAKPLRVE
jgi:hypothetical protein